MKAIILAALLCTIVSCLGGNYGYQWLTTQRWEVAFERSYFQLVALSTFGMLTLLFAWAHR